MREVNSLHKSNGNGWKSQDVPNSSLYKSLKYTFKVAKSFIKPLQKEFTGHQFHKKVAFNN